MIRVLLERSHSEIVEIFHARRTYKVLREISVRVDELDTPWEFEY